MKSKRKPAASKLPKTVGGAVDLLYKLRHALKTEEAKLNPLRQEIAEIEMMIFANFDKQELNGARGKLCSATVINQLVPNVTDWESVHKYILKHKALDLFERRISSTAWRERLEAKDIVPGIDPFTRVSIRVNGIGGAP